MDRFPARGLCSIAFVLTLGACSAVVGGKLNKLPEGGDSGAVRCTPMMPCDDGNLCNGVDMCSPDGNCVGGPTPVPDGLACDTDGNAATVEICVAGGCGTPSCGDRIVTPTGPFPEQCDDGNRVDGDGCENTCKFTCQNDAHCSDGNLCNGVEQCTLGLPGMRTCRMDGRPIPPLGTACLKPDGNMGTCMAGTASPLCR